MPRKDRSFSDRDVLRIYARNLTREEASNVEEAICEPQQPISDKALEVVIDTGIQILVTLLISRIPPLRIPAIRRFLTTTAKNATKQITTQLKLTFRGG